MGEDSANDFGKAYQGLELRLRHQAEMDGDLYVPNVEPREPVDHVLICMEPSLGAWAGSEEEARVQLESGFRNFLYSMEDFLLHFAARRFLCRPDEKYHVTDISKGAMLVDTANVGRRQRYARWHALLLEELALVARPGGSFIAVGNAVADHLVEHSFREPFTQILHYSGQAARARSEYIRGREDAFADFSTTVTHDDLMDVVVAVLAESGIPERFRAATEARVGRGELTSSRKKLLFGYRCAFEQLRASRVAHPVAAED